MAQGWGRMGTLIVLELEGDLAQQGFQVRLEIGCDRNSRAQKLVRGTLPPSPALADCLHRWQSHYRDLTKINTRTIQPQGISYDGTLHPVAACRESASKLQQALSTWLRAESFRDVEMKLRETLIQDHSVRILIRSTAPQIVQLPWHQWHCIEQSPQSEIAFSAPPADTTTARAAVRTVLAILGDSRGIDIDADRRALETVPKAHVTFLVEPTRQQLNTHLWEQSWDILFFAGHGTTEETGRIQINPGDSLSLEDLRYGLRQAIDRGLQLAIFNSCDGLGLVPALANLQLPNLIVMRQSVPDSVAQTFLKDFLAAFSTDRPLQLAIREARERLQGLEDRFPCASWLPVLYQNPAAAPLTWNPPPLPPRQDPRPLLLISVTVAFLVILARMWGMLQPLELWAYDFLMQIRLPEKPDSRILLVVIDRADVDQQYPGKAKPGETVLTDETAKALLQKLIAHQPPPRAIALDVFREATSSDRLKKLLAKDDRLIAICEPQSPGQRSYPPPPEIVENLEERVGFSSLIPDSSKTVRRALLIAQGDDICPVPLSLGLLTALHYLESEGWQLEVNEENGNPMLVHQMGQELIFHPLTDNAGGYRNIDDGGDQILLNYRATPFRQVSLTEFLNGIDPRWLEDRIVLIGSSDEEFGDVRLRTPLNPNANQPGVFIHAQIASQIISAALDDRPLLQPWSAPDELLWIFGWSLAGGTVAWYWRRLGVFVLTELVILAVLSSSAWVLLMQGWWVPLVPPALAVSTTAIVCTIYQRKHELQVLLVNPQGIVSIHPSNVKRHP